MTFPKEKDVSKDRQIIFWRTTFGSRVDFAQEFGQKLFSIKIFREKVGLIGQGGVLFKNHWVRVMERKNRMNPI
jgi:hypothetical protein